MAKQKFTRTAVTMSRLFCIVGGLVAFVAGLIVFLAGGQVVGIAMGIGGFGLLIWGAFASGKAVATSTQDQMLHFDE
jgi:hypothetical protein